MTQDKQLNAGEWLLKEGYPEFMNMTRDNLEIILNRYAAQFQHPQQPITDEAISAMAEKQYPDAINKHDDMFVETQNKIYIKRKAFIKGATAILSALGYSAGDNWISVDELPRKGERVIAFADYGGYFIAYLNKNNQWRISPEWRLNIPDSSFINITHWQPLPAPPIKQNK